MALLGLEFRERMNKKARGGPEPWAEAALVTIPSECPRDPWLVILLLLITALDKTLNFFLQSNRWCVLSLFGAPPPTPLQTAKTEMFSRGAIYWWMEEQFHLKFPDLGLPVCVPSG